MAMRASAASATAGTGVDAGGAVAAAGAAGAGAAAGWEGSVTVSSFFAAASARGHIGAP
jgi:hypothetical protein